MKLAFTTLGCPAWDLDKIIAHARQWGYDGVDFRGYHGVLPVYKLPEFSTHAADTAQRIADAGLEVPCFGTSACVYSKPQDALQEIRHYAGLCHAFRAQWMRVFGGSFQDRPPQEAVTVAARTLREAANIVAEYGVQLAVETHDSWIDSDLLCALMEETSSPHVGLLWDVHHPYRMRGEHPEKTWSTIGRWVVYTHVKDSRLRRAPNDSQRKSQPYDLCLPGEGDVPLKAILSVLRCGGYNGYLTFEWEKQWHPEIEDPETAFPRYAAVMRRLLANACG